MASPTQSEPKISLKLMIHREKKKVIFAEADGHFVDTLFSFMTLPLGTIARLVAKHPDDKLKPLLSLQNVYKSLMDLPDDYFSAKESKYVMLNPRSSSYDLCRWLKLNVDDTEPTKYFICCNSYSYCQHIFSTSNVARCSTCRALMNRETFRNDSTSADDSTVFVPNLTSFIVTDDLCVMPNTSAFIIQSFCDNGITDVSHIEEKTLDIGLEQISILLNLAVRFKYPLTCFVFSTMNFIPYSPTQGFSVQDFVSNKLETGSKRMMLNVTLQKSTSKFLFAEADSDFVEFLFCFLEIPLGTVIGKLFNGTSSLQCLDNLYASICKMNVGEGIKSQNLKDTLMQPQCLKYVSTNQIFPLVYETTISFGQKPFTYVYPKASYLMSSGAKFMLTDDLVITPLSSTSTVALLFSGKVSLNDVEIHKVEISIEEGLKILQASLNSVSAFTDAILKEVSKTKK